MGDEVGQAGVIISSGWVALALLLVFGVVAAAFAWQERSRLPQRSVIYGAEDAVDYVMARLSPAASDQLDDGDVRRILEWEIQYLQQRMAADEDPVVVAGYDAARHAQERLHELGHSYRGDLIVEVMELQAEYLVVIGAVAAPADVDEVGDVFPGQGQSGQSTDPGEPQEPQAG